MKRFIYEVTESWKIALAQMQAHKMRSVLTALGVIIGIIAVTLMGSAIGGIETGFDRAWRSSATTSSTSRNGRGHVDDWWNYRNRREIKTRVRGDAEAHHRGDAELEARHRRADIELMRSREVRRQ